MTQLTDLVGPRHLDAVDFDTEKMKEFYGDGYEDCSVCRFRLDGIVYVAIEDPSDGYRSSMRGLITPNNPAMKNVFPPVKVIGRMRTEGEFGGLDDVLELVDAFTDKVVLEVGTDNCDDYYPRFVASFHPENMATNANIVAAEEKANKAADGWIEWAGGECPVADDVLVQVHVDFYPSDVWRPAGTWAWDHDRPVSDQITAYRIVGEAA